MSVQHGGRWFKINSISGLRIDRRLVAVMPQQVAGVHDRDEGVADVLTEEDDEVPGLLDQPVQHGAGQLLYRVFLGLGQDPLQRLVLVHDVA